MKEGIDMKKSDNMHYIKTPALITISTSPTAGIHKNHEAVPAKLVPYFPKKAAVKISRRKSIFVKKRTAKSNNPVFYVSNPVTAQHGAIPDLARFIKENVKVHQRNLVTDDAVEEIKSIWQDTDCELTLPLPDYNASFVLLVNGYFDLIKGKFHRFKHGKSKYNPGYSRFLLHAEYLNDSPYDGPEFDPILPALAQLVTGFPTQRFLIWAAGSELCDFVQKYLKAVLPEPGAFQYLQTTANMPEYLNAADSDSHCIIVKVASAKVLTATFWKKLLLFSDRKLPVLIMADFPPMLADDDNEIAEKLQKNMFIIPENLEVGNLPLDITAEVVNQLVSSALRKLFLKNNSIEPDICPEVDAIFFRPDPNNVTAMLKWLFAKEMKHTGAKLDIITVQEIALRLKEPVTKLGGDPDKFNEISVGMALTKLEIEKDFIKLPDTKGKVSVIVGYVWI